MDTGIQKTETKRITPKPESRPPLSPLFWKVAKKKIKTKKVFTAGSLLFQETNGEPFISPTQERAMKEPGNEVASLDGWVGMGIKVWLTQVQNTSGIFLNKDTQEPSCF